VVVRVILRFREHFWEDLQVDGKSLRDMSFLHSDNPDFPTWWTTMPRVTPMLTGWSAGPNGISLAAKSDEEVVDRAMRSVAELLHLPGKELRELMVASYFHNWWKDPFSRGAYSYACVGGFDAARELGRPVSGTLFFAGEATNYSGRNGTVDGAIASGQRAAREIVESQELGVRS
jgi:monoamine oxidase